MKYGLLGKNLSHSFSKDLHGRFGSYDYEIFDLGEESLDEFFKRKDISGINVTIPYKERAILYCDEISDISKRIGVINTITFGEKIRGYNTDYLGFKYTIESRKIDIENRDCLILGDGATSNTIKVVLEDLKARSIKKVSRRSEVLNYSNIYDEDPHVIINATPVGMYPNNGESLVDLKRFKSLEAVVDVIYNPLVSKLIFDGKNLGLKTAQGLPMLIEQGRRSSEIFMGKEITNELQRKVENKIRRYKENLILIGMPGVGKSQFAYELAKKMNREYIDLDKVIEKRYMEPSKIIKEKGENFFREIESKVAFEIGKENHKVIATGGGIVVREENLYSLKQNGRIYCLERDLDKLSRRKRPLSQGEGAINRLFEERKDKYYRFSDRVIHNNGRLDLSVMEIIRDFYEN